MLRRELELHRRLVAFVVSYLVVFTIYGVLARRPETALYTCVTASLIALFVSLHLLVGLPERLLWALALLGLCHLSGGLVPLGGDQILYNLQLIPPPLAVDRLVHAFGSAVMVMVVWTMMRPHLRFTGRVPWNALIVVALAGMGVGAIGEVAEFLGSRVSASNVGGYVNTGWDLVFDLIGCLAAVAWLRRASTASLDVPLPAMTRIVEPWRAPAAVRRVDTRERLTQGLLWCGALAPAIAAASVFIGASLTPGYSHLADTVSQLAAKGAPHPEVIQTGLVLWGLLLEGFAWGAYRRLRGVSGARAFALALVLSGCAVQLAAFVRDDPNLASAPSTVAGAIHGSLATVAFLALLGAIFLFARMPHTDRRSHSIARVSSRFVLFGLIIGTLFEVQLAQPIEGSLQRLFYALCAAWLVLVSRWLRIHPAIAQDLRGSRGVGDRQVVVEVPLAHARPGDEDPRTIGARGDAGGYVGTVRRSVEARAPEPGAGRGHIGDGDVVEVGRPAPAPTGDEDHRAISTHRHG
jgi:Protein of unknown function (DUF998)